MIKDDCVSPQAGSSIIISEMYRTSAGAIYEPEFLSTEDEEIYLFIYFSATRRARLQTTSPQNL